MKKQIVEFVGSIEIYSTNLFKEISEYFLKIYDSIPAEYKSNSRIEIDTEDCFGECSSGIINCKIYYTRDETDEEYENRLKNEEIRNKLIQEVKDEEDYNTYLLLKKRFENKEKKNDSRVS